MRGGRPGGLQCCRDPTRCATFQEYSCSCLLIWKLAFLAHGAGRRNGTLVQRMFHCLGDAIGVTDAKPSCYCSLKAYWKSNGLTVPCKLTRPHSASIARWLVSSHDDRLCRPAGFHPVGPSGHIESACGGPQCRKDRLASANRVGGGVALLPHCPHNKGQ